MSIEEKAKSYDKVIERAKKLHDETGFDYVKITVETIFPELVESGDEKIRKTLIDYFNTCSGDYYGELKLKDIIAWLEKQGEQQKSSWSEDDEKNYQILQGIICYADITTNLANRLSNWFNSLRERINLN